MLNHYIGKKIEMRKVVDGSSLVGIIGSAKSPMMNVIFDIQDQLEVGDQLECGIGDGSNFLKLQATVVSINSQSAELWISIQSIVPGVERALRVITPGMTLVLEADSKTVSASLCDCSETGLRVSSLSQFDEGSEIICKLGSEGHEIFLRTKVVRTINILESEYQELGLHIVDCDRLSRARWNHLISGLLRRYGAVA